MPPASMSAYYNENDPKTAAWLRDRAGLPTTQERSKGMICSICNKELSDDDETVKGRDGLSHIHCFMQQCLWNCQQRRWRHE